MGCHRISATAGDALDRRLEPGVCERLDLPAVVADEMVVMLAVGVSRLEARDAVAEVDPLHEAELVHPVECAVDARDPDAAAARADGVVDLLGRETAVLLAEKLDDEPPCASAPTARATESRERRVDPCLRHSDNDTRSQRRATVFGVRVLLALLAVFVLGGCSNRTESDHRRTVVASFYPLAWATEQVTGRGAKVVNLTPPGVEPHDVELTPSDVALIHDAELVVYVGSGFQPAVEGAVADRAGSSLDVLDGAGDPHVWLDPVAFAGIVQRIASRAKQLGLEPEAAGAVTSLVSRLRGLDVQYRRGLEDCERRVVVTAHAAFGRLVRRYGLTEISLAGRTPESEPSPRDLERLVAEVRASRATTVFAEPLVSSRVAETVTRETDARVAMLDPIEGLSQERLDAGEDYLSVMRSNLVALRQALGCR